MAKQQGRPLRPRPFVTRVYPVGALRRRHVAIVDLGDPVAQVEKTGTEFGPSHARSLGAQGSRLAGRRALSATAETLPVTSVGMALPRGLTFGDSTLQWYNRQGRQ